jgi:hypothetical protein
MGVIEIEYEPKKLMYSPKVTKNPISPDYTLALQALLKALV